MRRLKKDFDDFCRVVTTRMAEVSGAIMRAVLLSRIRVRSDSTAVFSNCSNDYFYAGHIRNFEIGNRYADVGVECGRLMIRLRSYGSPDANEEALREILDSLKPKRDIAVVISFVFDDIDECGLLDLIQLGYVFEVYLEWGDVTNSVILNLYIDGNDQIHGIYRTIDEIGDELVNLESEEEQMISGCFVKRGAKRGSK